MLDESCMVGKRIKHIEVGGFGVLIVLEDNTIFDYTSSSGGDSYWDIIKDPNFAERLITKKGKRSIKDDLC